RSADTAPWSRYSGGGDDSGGRRKGAASACRASAADTGAPSPTPSGRSSAGGSAATRTIDTPSRWRALRIALRAPGTGIATPNATSSAAASASTRTRRRGRRAPCGSTGSETGGQSTSDAAAASSCTSSAMQLPQRVQRARGARLDGSRTDPERGGRLGLREIEEVAATEDEPRLLGQLVELGEHPAALVGGDRDRPGGRGRAPRGLLAGRSQLEPSAAARSPAAVPRLVRDDPEQPGSERPGGAEAAEGAPGLDERLLRDVLSVGAASGDEVRESDGGLPVRADE